MSGRIVKVSGPLVVAEGMEDANMADVVRVGKQQLIGEILNMTGGSASIQVYEETSGLGPGAEVTTTEAVDLARGLQFAHPPGAEKPPQHAVVALEQFRKDDAPARLLDDERSELGYDEPPVRLQILYQGMNQHG